MPQPTERFLTPNGLSEAWRQASMQRAEAARGGLPIVELHGFVPNTDSFDSYGNSNIDGIHDITKWVKSLKVLKSVKAPFETISITASIPLDAMSRIMPGKVRSTTDEAGKNHRMPHSGFWVVVRVPQSATFEDPTTNAHGWPALGWGYCKSLHWGIETEIAESGSNTNTKRSTPVRIECESWWSLVSRARIVLAPGHQNSAHKGSVWNFGSWVHQMRALMSSVSGHWWDATGHRAGYPGYAFQKLWNGEQLDQPVEDRSEFGHGVCHLMLPNTLLSNSGNLYTVPQPLELSDGQVLSASDQLIQVETGQAPSEVSQNVGETVGVSLYPSRIKDQIPLIWNRFTCGKWAPNRLPNMYVVPGEALSALGNMVANGTVGQWFTQSFQPDPYAVELFPVLEYPWAETIDPLSFPLEDGPQVNNQTAEPYIVEAPTEPTRRQDDFRFAGGQTVGNGPLSLQDASAEELQAFESAKAEFDRILTREQSGLDTAENRANLDRMLGEHEAFFTNLGGLQGLANVRVDKLVLPDKMTPLGKALGAQPGLVYRLRPKLFAPITHKFTTLALRNMLNVQGEDFYYAEAGIVPSEYVSNATTLYTSYGNDSVEPYSLVDNTLSSPNFVQRSHIVSIQFQSLEEDRVNGTWIQGPVTQGSQMGETWGFTGFPMIDPFDHRKHGLRLYDVSWPFFQSGADEGENEATAGYGTLKMKITALCDMFFVILGSTDTVPTHNRATVRIKYRPTLIKGTHAAFELPPTPNVPYTKAGTPNPGLGGSAAQWEVDSTPSSADDPSRLPGSLTGYVESVQHDFSVRADTGAVTATTTVQLTNAQQVESSMCHVNWPIRAITFSEEPFLIDGNDFVFGEFVNGQFISDSESRDVAPTDSAALNEISGSERTPPGDE